MNKNTARKNAFGLGKLFRTVLVIAAAVLMTFLFIVKNDVAHAEGTGAYLTFSGNSAFTVSRPAPDSVSGYLEYSVDGVNWTRWDVRSTEKISSSAAAPYVLYLRGKGNTTVQGDMEYNWILRPDGEYDEDFKIISLQPSAPVNCTGNIMTLLDYEKVALGQNVVMGEGAFFHLFYGASNLLSAPELPALNLTADCYASMFEGCSSLKKAPELPATVLADYCYSDMFFKCTALTEAPALPADTLAIGCYYGMFQGCSVLVNAPSLAALNLKDYCYGYMFADCTSLVNAPELNASVVASYCYEGMFSGCGNLVSAPALPATTVKSGCYAHMFSGCKKLAAAPALPAATLASYCYSAMFEGCSGLTACPALIADKLDEYCYYEMFKDCTNIVTGPALNAVNMVTGCYAEMFSGCTRLATAPVLPAEQMADYCYSAMFMYCSSLKVMPELPATTLADNCYEAMFEGCGFVTVPDFPDIELKPACYAAMFSNCTSLTKAPALPTAKLADYCYSGMFQGCTKLQTLPVLQGVELAAGCYMNMFSNCTLIENVDSNMVSATKLAPYCYSSMFAGCSKLKAAPALPAINLEEGCYQGMFEACTALTSMPALPATEMQPYCYYNMFRHCTALITPTYVLPATKLASYCYGSMFDECYNLETAPALPATEMQPYCYYSMFYNCKKLTEVPDLPATKLAEGCYKFMFVYCESLEIYTSSTGTAQRAWSIPAVSSQPTEWAERMFKYAPKVAFLAPTPGTVYYTKGASKIVPELTGVSLSISGNIGLDFYINIPYVGTEFDKIYAEVNGEKYPLKEAESTANGYQVTHPMVAKGMMDEVTINVYLDGEKPTQIPLVIKIEKDAEGGEEYASEGSFTTSVFEYITILKKKYPSGEWYEFANAMETYGLCSMAVFGYELEISVDAIPTKECDLKAYNVTAPGVGEFPDGIEYLGSSLVLESGTAVRHYFKTDDISGCSFSLGEKTEPGTAGSGDLSLKAVAVPGTSGIYYVEISDIPAQKIGDMYTLKVSKAGLSVDISYSVLTYFYKAMEMGNHELTKLGEAVYAYYTAARKCVPMVS